MSRSIEVIKSYSRETTDHEVNLSVRMLRVDPRGEVLAYRGNPPRQRPLVIGIGVNQLVVSYPIGPYGETGFHHIAEPHISKMLAAGLIARLHGSISPEKTDRLSKASHVISLFKMHERDINALGGKHIANHIIRQSEPLERGKLTPEAFITEPVAQALLRSLSADRLEIITARPSYEIYHVNKDNT